MTPTSPSVIPSRNGYAPEDLALLNASVVHREDLTNELAILRVRPDSGDVAPFLPGQYATLGTLPDPTSDQMKKKGLGKLLLRPYSVASSPNERHSMEFYLALVNDGRTTPRLWTDGVVGGRVYMTPKCKGTFTIDGVPDGMDLVAVATGTGLAPFVSMVKTYRGTGKWRRFAILHGTRLCADLGYRAELEALAAADDSVFYLPTCSREPIDGQWVGFRGRVNQLMSGDALDRYAGIRLDPANCHVLLCGNPAMIDETEADLVPRGFVVRDRANPQGNLHFERYW